VPSWALCQAGIDVWRTRLMKVSREAPNVSLSAIPNFVNKQNFRSAYAVELGPLPTLR
jgi:hypothetical protein